MPVTNANAHQYLPLVQALAEGKKLQIRTSPERAWENTGLGGFEFAFPPECYRIKPEPRRFTILVPTPDHPLGKDAKPQLVHEGMFCVSDDWEEIEVVEVVNEQA